MRLKKIYINGYKNLIDTSIEFNTDENLIAIIGNNGTGKSNLIEALIHIFLGLYYLKPPEFKYQIEYDAHGKSVSINNMKHDDGYPTINIDRMEISMYRFKDWIRQPELNPPFPANVFCYYSGTCDRTKTLIKKYNISYKAKLRRQTANLERQFVFSDIEHAEWCLLGLFAHRHRNILDMLSLGKFDEFQITINPPESFSKEKDEPIFWGTDGAIQDFISVLDNNTSESYLPYERNLAKSDNIVRTYVFENEELENVGRALEKRKTNLYSMLQALNGKNMLTETKLIVINKTSAANYPTDDLSEGEKQLLSVIGGLKLLEQNECLVLLDEPDTHLNPNWSWEYDSLLNYAIKDEQSSTSTVLLATHDPVIISGLTKEQVLIARLDKEKLLFEKPVRDPRGQGVANVLTSSEYFGLPSSLDKNTQNLLDERLKIAFNEEPLTRVEKERLASLNKRLDYLGLSISFRDPKYKEFIEEKYGKKWNN